MAKNFVSKPKYPGGNTALRKFVSEHLQYPPEALKNKISGVVKVRYSLDYRGKVVGAAVKKGLGYGCDEEALRVVNLLRFDVPQDRKKKVRIHQDLNIHFRLPKKKQPPTPTKIVYTHTAGTQVQKKDEESSGYGYTIRW